VLPTDRVGFTAVDDGLLLVHWDRAEAQRPPRLRILAHRANTRTPASRVGIEIQAETPDGVPEDEIRTVQGERPTR